MKKAILVLLVGLLWCNVGFADCHLIYPYCSDEVYFKKINERERIEKLEKRIEKLEKKQKGGYGKSYGNTGYGD